MTLDGVPGAVDAIRSWGEAREWCGYDPYDGLSSPVASVLTLGTRLGRRLLTQSVKRSPLNLRPLLGIRPAHDQKAIGLVASAYARLAGSGDSLAATAAERWLAWLNHHRAGDAGARLWGYHFPVQTRVFRYPRNAPNTIATTFVVQAFLESAKLCDWRHLTIALDAVEALVERMHVGGDRPFFRYVEREDELIHNANSLACAVVARAGMLSDDARLQEIAADALATTLDAQRDDGSWPYSANSSHDWIDNFHTGYVLESLARCLPVIEWAREPLLAGVEYWRTKLFLDDGTPKYYADSLYPLDAHNYAQALETWVALIGIVPGAFEAAERAAAVLIEMMLDPRGFVIFQRHRHVDNRVPLIRWSTAPTFRALAGLTLARATK